MKQIREFTISFGGLNVGKHHFEYSIDNSFFENFEYSEIKTGKLKVELKLEKKVNMLILDFKINGTVNVPCDRCLDNFDFNISAENRLIAKFGTKIFEESDEVIVINESDNQINIAHYIYEYIVLSLPYKLVHPENNNGTPSCNPEIISKLNEHLTKEDIEDDFDPRWNILKNLNNN
ncbi:MAG: DUF177 domain-containing protein [Bacteroidota bacterium]|nr:DUF177 domain-containing protein [Bacteroidota bacterium]